MDSVRLVLQDVACIVCGAEARLLQILVVGVGSVALGLLLDMAVNERFSFSLRCVPGACAICASDDTVFQVCLSTCSGHPSSIHLPCLGMRG